MSRPPRKSITRPKDYRMFVKIREKMTGKRLTNFVKKIKSFSWENVQGKVTENYDDLSEPDREFYPQIKTGFKLFKGDYVPQIGFSAHCQPKGGDYIDFKKCMETIQEDQNKPCVIIGQPGSGKTILMKRLAKTFMIANQLHGLEEIGLWDKLVRRFHKESQEYDIVFHFNIRDMPNLIDGTLAEVIFNPAVTGLTKKEAKFGLRAILKKKIQVIMFFDGLDQATWEPECDRKIGPWETASTGRIFGNILTGHLLSHVRIVISSREHSVALLSKAMRPDFVAALVGFSEADAKSLYCELMGWGAAEDWDKMHLSNPAMHSMCLTPLFLIFYMITKKRNPEDPPDCATGVMVSIIQIFLECENARNLDDSLLGNLKQMAFQGTKEQRVVFTSKDLEKFDLAYKDISDIIIQVPGLAILGHKILEGMYRFFFSHQTLQEILAALHVVGMERNNFEKVVDEEFPKPYWSIVRSFTCGILKNERVKCNISDMILSQDPEDFARKCEHLIKHLQAELDSSRSPADKLETFVALKEANDLDLLQGLAENLDFSNSTLTPPMINILCSVMKYIGEIPRLSLANSNLDDVLLKVLVNEGNALEIKIGELDMRGNVVCRNYNTWGRLFKSFEIRTFLTDIPFHSLRNNNHESTEVKRIIEMAEGNVENIIIDQPTKLRLHINLLERLANYEIGIKFTQVILVPEKDEIYIWRETFSRMTIIIDHCFIVNPKQVEGRVDVIVWKHAILAASVDNVKKISLMMANGIAFSVGDLVIMNTLNFSEEMPSLSVTLDHTVFDVDVWQQAFQHMQISVGQCFIVPRQIDDEFDVRMWIEAAGVADVENVKKISLKSLETISLTLDDLMLFNETKFVGEVHQLRIIAGANPDVVNNFSEALQKMKLTTDRVLITPPRSSEGVIDARAWMAMEEHARNRQITEVALDSTEEMALNVNDIASLSGCGFCRMFAHLWIESSHQSYDPITWRQIFLDMKFNVDYCFIKPPILETGKVDVELWIDTVHLATCDNIRMVPMATTQEISLTYSDIECLTTAKVFCLVNRLRLNRIKTEVESFIPALWRQTFQQTMLCVNHCILEPPQITKGVINIHVWSMAAAVIADIGKVARVSLVSTEDKAIYITELKRFGKSRANVEISELWIKPDHQNPDGLMTWKSELKKMPFVARPIIKPTKTGQAFILKPRVLILTPHHPESEDHKLLESEIYEAPVLHQPRRTDFNIETLRDPTDDYGPSKRLVKLQHPERSEPQRTDTLGQAEFSILSRRPTRLSQPEILTRQQHLPADPITEILRDPTELHIQIEKKVPRKGLTSSHKPSWHSKIPTPPRRPQLPDPDSEIEDVYWLRKSRPAVPKPTLVSEIGDRPEVAGIRTGPRDGEVLSHPLKMPGLPKPTRNLPPPPNRMSNTNLRLWPPPPKIPDLPKPTQNQTQSPHSNSNFDSKVPPPHPPKLPDSIKSLRSLKAPSFFRPSKLMKEKIYDLPPLDHGEETYLGVRADEPSAKTKYENRVCLSVGHCYVKPLLQDKHKLNAYDWIEKGLLVSTKLRTKVTLKASERITVTIHDIETLNNCGLPVEVSKICIMPKVAPHVITPAWQKVFEHLRFTVDDCHMYPPSQGDVDVQNWIEKAKIIEAANVRRVTLKSSNRILLEIDDVLTLKESGLDVQIDELRIKPDAKTFDAETWRQCFERVNFTVGHCVIEPPQLFQGVMNTKLWLDAVEAVRVRNTKVSLCSRDDCVFDINNIIHLNEWATDQKIDELCIKPDLDAFDPDTWQRAFSKMSFTVENCFIEAPKPLKGAAGVKVWVDAAKIARMRSSRNEMMSPEYSCLRKVQLYSSEDNPLSIHDVKVMSEHKNVPLVTKLWLKPNVETFDKDLWRETFRQLTFNIDNCYVLSPVADERKEIDLKIWVAAIKAVTVPQVKSMFLVKKEPFDEVEEVELSPNDFETLINFRIHFKITRLCLKEESQIQPSWQIPLTELGIDVAECLVLPLRSIEGKTQTDRWLLAARTLERKNDSVKILLTTSKNNALSICDVRELNGVLARFEISELWLKPTGCMAASWEKVFAQFKFMVGNCYVILPHSDKDELDVEEWIRKGKAANCSSVDTVSLISIERIRLTVGDIKALSCSKFHVEIPQISVKPDLQRFDEDEWRKAFQEMPFTVDSCLVEVPDLEGKCDMNVWMNAAKAVNNVKEVSLKSSNEIRVDLSDVILLSDSSLLGEIHRLRIQFGTESFDRDTLRQLFRRIKVTADHCVIEPPQTDEGKIDFQRWKSALEATRIKNFGEVSLCSTENCAFDITNFQRLQEMAMELKPIVILVRELHIRIESNSFDEWRKVFQKMAFVIDHCLIELPLLLEVEALKLWIEVAESTASKVSVYSTEDNPLSIHDVITLSKCEQIKKILKFLIEPDVEGFDSSLWQETFQRINFDVDTCSVKFPVSKEGVFDFEIGMEVAKAANVPCVKQIFLVPTDSVCAMEETELDLGDIIFLTASNFCGKLAKVQMQLPDPFDENLWSDAFRSMSFTVNHCFIEPPLPKKSRTDVTEWIGAAKAISTVNVKQISLRSTEKVVLSIYDLELITNSNLECKMLELWMKPNPRKPDSVAFWRNVFENMTLSVDRCYIQPPHSLKEAIDVNGWIEKARAVDVANVGQVTLKSAKGILVTVDDIKTLNNCDLTVEIQQLRIQLDSDSVSDLLETIKDLKLNIDGYSLIFLRSSEGVIDMTTWTNVANALRTSTMKQVLLDSTADAPFSIDDIVSLNETGNNNKISRLWIQPCLATFDPISWQQVFDNLTYKVDHCFVLPPKFNTGDIDVELWQDAVDVCDCENVAKISFGTTDEIELDISNIDNLTESKFHCQINQLRLQLNAESFAAEIWRQTFLRPQLHIKHCLIETLTSKGEIDYYTWRTAAEVISCGNVDKVTLCFVDDAALSITDFYYLNDSLADFEILDLWIAPRSKKLDDPVAWKAALESMRFNIARCFVKPPKSLNRPVDVTKWIETANAVIFPNRHTVTLKSTETILLDMDGISVLSSCNIPKEIPQISIRPEPQTFDEDAWKETFRGMSFTVDGCRVDKGKCDVDVWVKAAETAIVDNVKNVSLVSKGEIQVNISEIMPISDSSLPGEIHQLRVSPDFESFDISIWREAFQKLRVSVKQCTIGPPRSSEGKIDTEVWVEAFKAAKLGNSVSVLLDVTEDCAFDINDIIQLNTLKSNQKIEKLRVKFDSGTYNEDVWRQAFQQMSFKVDKFLIEPLYTSQEEHAVKPWIDAAKIVGEEKPVTKQKHSFWGRPWPENVMLSCTEDNPLLLVDIIDMNKLRPDLEMETLWIIPDAKTYSWTEWYHAFDSITFHIENCIVKPPSPIEGDKDRQVWLSAATSARQTRKSKVTNVLMKPIASFYSVEKIDLSVRGTEILTQSEFYGEIHEARYKPIVYKHGNLETGWEEAFKSMTFIIQHLLIKNPTCVGECLERNGMELWIQAANRIVFEKVKKVSLMSATEIPMNKECIALLSESYLQGNIATVELKKLEYPWIKEKSSLDWARLGIVARKFRSSFSFKCDPPDSNDLRYFVESHGNVKIGRIIILSYNSHRLMVTDSKKSCDEAADNRNELVLIVRSGFLHSNLQTVGRLIRDTGFVHVTIAAGRLDGLTSELAGYQIQTLAVSATAICNEITQIVSRCNVEKLYLVDDTNKEIIKKAQKHSDVTILSATEWDDMFAKIERQGPTGPLTESIFERSGPPRSVRFLPRLT